MTYSGTFMPGASAGFAAGSTLVPGVVSATGGGLARAAAANDPIQDARDLLRQAARLPFAAGHPRQWSTRFVRHVAAARTALRQHIARTMSPDSPMSLLEIEEPRLHSALERQREEHLALARQADELYAEANTNPDADIWRMIDLGERAIMLEMALARHHNRLLRLVYEATNRELGGEAG